MCRSSVACNLMGNLMGMTIPYSFLAKRIRCSHMLCICVHLVVEGSCVGGAGVSWLARSTPYQAVWVPALIRDIAFCS